jgi:predicted ATPase
MDISGLEDEYNLSGAKPKLIYIKTPAPEREPRLKELLDRIRDSDTASYKPFTSADELRGLIENDLAVLLTERFEQMAEAVPSKAPEQWLTNLPVPRNPLIGREFELTTVSDLLRLEDVCLVTLTGPGGTGKSRLGLQVGLDMRRYFEDGVFLIALESIRDPTLVVSAIAQTLHVRETPDGRPLAEVLADYLRDKHMLLLLDNFEQVVSAAPSVSALLESGPRLKILVTSRTPLRVRGEKELPVPPLAVPLSQHAFDLQSLSQYAAVALFIQRAQGVKPDFAVTNENAPAVAEICYRLDGLPLAIELAAARIKILPPQALLVRLAHRFDVLRGGMRDLPERQQTLRRALDWSYDLLDDHAKKLFRRLSVFAGGWTLDAAEAVCNVEGDLNADVLDEMESLVDNSLLTRSVGKDGEMRFGMLETIREYAMERLLESGEVDHLRQRQAHFYLALVEQAEPELTTSGQTQWFNQLDIEHENIRAVLAWSRQHNVELGLKLCGSIWHFWEWHNFIGEGRAWLETFIAQSLQPTAARGKALHAASAFAVYQGDYEAAEVYMEEALPIFQQLNDKRGIATALNELGAIALGRGRLADARQLFEQSLAIKRKLGDDWLIANSIGNLGLVAGYQNDYASAYTLHQESLALYRALNEMGDMAIAMSNLGYVAMHLGKLDEAQARQAESLRLFDEVGDKDGLAECLERFAMLANANANFRRAAQLFGAASVLRKETGTVFALPERAEYDSELPATRAQLDTATFDAAWDEGRALSMEQAIDYALSREEAQ